MHQEISAKILGITFSNMSTSFYIMRCELSDTGEPISVKGSFPGVPIKGGLKAKFTGRIEENPKYGRQFSATTCVIIPDKGRSGVINYLIANVPSIGPITGAKLYDAFGDDLLRILDEEPQKVADLPFLNRLQSEAILKEWSAASEKRTVSIFLSELGLGPTSIKNVLTYFGTLECMDLIKEDPYCLTEVHGIGFTIADTAARKFGISVDDPRRVRAMILFAMNDMAISEGHVFCTSDQIQEYISKRLFSKHSLEAFSYGKFMDSSMLYPALASLQESEDIISDGNHLYLESNWLDEDGAAEAISNNIEQGPYKFGDLVQILNEFEQDQKIQFSDEQREAFLSLSKSRVITISGYPGTGKTLLITAFVYLFEKFKLQYSLLSPTGIAAKRLSQVTSRPASTIHRALSFKNDGTFDFNRSNKYDNDAIIIDEMSMVDASLFYSLTSALLSKTIIIMVGDSAQLPSVGAGYVLHNLMNCSKIPHVALTHIYRQENLSDIIKVAHLMLNGQPIDTKFNRDSEFVFLNYQPDEVTSQICKLASLLKEKGRNFQVVSPMHDGELGVNNLNLSLRGVLNPGYDNSSSYIKHGDVNIYEGDRVMVIRNNYDKGVYNGDVGKVTKISLRDDFVEVKIFDWFDQSSSIPKCVDKMITFKVEEARQNLKVAYVCTIHKCVSPDTIVETESGLSYIKDIPNEGMIDTPYGGRNYCNKVQNPPMDMIKIITNDGYELKVTNDHKIDVWDNELGYISKEASELKINDILSLKLGCSYGNQKYYVLHEPIRCDGEDVCKIPKHVNEDFAELLGLITNKYCLCEKGLIFKVEQPEIINRISELCESLFKIKVRINFKKIDGRNYIYVIAESAYLARWLKDIGGIGNVIPECIMKSSLQVQSKFLRGLFGYSKISNSIRLHMKSKSIHDTVKVMLLRFGIASISKINNNSYDLSMSRYDNNLFYNKIGFILKFNNDIMEKPFTIGRDTCFIPVLKSEILKLLRTDHNTSLSKMVRKTVLYRNRTSRNKLRLFLDEIITENDVYDKLLDRLNYHHTNIKSIEKIHGTSVCVEVPDGHKFIQNGFKAGNCQGKEFDYVILPMTMQYGIMLYRNLIYTAITRAKKKVFVFGDPKAFVYASMNDRQITRNSNLSELVSEHYNIKITEEVSSS